jgi:hypothetical protein
MDQHKEYRLTYLAAAPHSIYTGFAWIVSASMADSISRGYSILFFIVALSFTFPAGELLRKILGGRNFISATNKLSKLFTLSAFTIPACYPLVYLLCKANINYFFPAFSILVGAHYLIFVYAYDRLAFGALAVALIAQAILSLYFLPISFSISGYIAGLMILASGVYNLRAVKKELHDEVVVPATQLETKQ